MANWGLATRPPKGWRARLELSSRTEWQAFRRHPWLAQALSITRPQLILNGMRHTEWALHALDGLGLTIQEMMHIHTTLLRHVRGCTPRSTACASSPITASSRC